MSDARRADPVVRLLSVLVFLMALLVLGLGVGGLVAFRQITGMRGQLDGMRSEIETMRNELTSMTVALDRGTRVVEEMTERQETLSSNLRARAGTSLQKLEQLRQRRAAIDPIKRGPFGKMEQVVQLNQLLADEMLLMLEHLAHTQASLGRAVRPLEAQEDFGTGVGGGGKPDPESEEQREPE